MSKYIKVDDLIWFCENNSVDESVAIGDIERMNHIEVVMCKDCKYRNENKTCGREKRVVDWYIVNDDWFCADGEEMSHVKPTPKQRTT